MLGGVEKWDDRKWWDNGKDFNFPSFCLVGGEKVKGKKKWVCINYIPLLKNNAQLKQKSNKKPRKNKQSPKFIKK